MTATRLTAFLGDTPLDHVPCADCVRCATCRREWCPTVVEKCPGDVPFARHPTGGLGTRDDEYCYRCTNCPGGYFQFHLDEYPPCVSVETPPHVVADDKGWD